MLWDAIHKLESQESQWYNSVQVRRPENWRPAGVTVRVQGFLYWRAGEDWHSSAFLFYGVPQWTVDAHPHGRWWIFFTQSMHSNANLFASGSTLKDSPRNTGFSAIRASLRPVKWTHKINHHNWIRKPHLETARCALLGHIKGQLHICAPAPGAPGLLQVPSMGTEQLAPLFRSHSLKHSLAHSQSLILCLSHIKDMLDAGAQRL